MLESEQQAHAETKAALAAASIELAQLRSVADVAGALERSHSLSNAVTSKSAQAT